MLGESDGVEQGDMETSEVARRQTECAGSWCNFCAITFQVVSLHFSLRSTRVSFQQIFSNNGSISRSEVMASYFESQIFARLLFNLFPILRFVLDC